MKECKIFISLYNMARLKIMEVIGVEILFKGRRIDNKEWIKGGYYKCKDGREYIVGECRSFYEVDSESVSIYTGIDINEEQVFLGDVAHYTMFEDGEIVLDGHFKVIFKDGSFYTEDFQGGTQYLVDDTGEGRENEKVELVGHITDKEWVDIRDV